VSITNFIPGDIVKIGAGFVDWEVVGRSREGMILLKSGMTGRHCKVKPEHLKVWKPDA